MTNKFSFLDFVTSTFALTAIGLRNQTSLMNFINTFTTLLSEMHVTFVCFLFTHICETLPRGQ